MCNLFGGNDGPSPQELAAQQQQQIQAQEDTRKAAVGQGKSSIDSAFSQFDQPYFDNYTKSYTAAQDAPLADQYGIAKDQLTAALAGRDTLESTGGINALSQLDKTNQDAQAGIGASAVDATNQLKTNVNNSKNSLYAENNAAADPLAAASQAQATSGAIVAPQSAPTMSNVFAGALAPFATAQKVNSQSLYPNNSLSLNAPLSGNGSSTSN
jgi:hypothetical protein